MIKNDKENIVKLKNGDFSEVQLNKWFVNHDFANIFATIEGCDKKINYNILSFIAMYATFYMEKPNVEDWLDIDALKTLIINNGDYPFNIDQMNFEELMEYWQKQISRICEQILEKVIIVSSKYFEYRPIMNKLSNSNNEKIRLYCCANGGYVDYSHFLKDESQRVRDVANIRYRLHCEMLNCDSVQRERIDYLTTALEVGVIQCFDSGVVSDDPTSIYLCFDSLLFEHSYSILRFNKDIFNSIHRNRILANTLNDLIKEEEIVLKQDFVPECLKKESLMRKLSK